MSPVFRYPGFGFQMQCLNLSFKFCHVMYSNPFYTAHFISWETWQRTVFVSFGISVLLFKVSFFFFLFSFGLENNHPPVNKASMEVEICIMRNKTGLQPVSRPVDQFSILGGGWSGGSKSLWCHSCADRYFTPFHGGCKRTTSYFLGHTFLGIIMQLSVINSKSRALLCWGI